MIASPTDRPRTPRGSFAAALLGVLLLALPLAPLVGFPAVGISPAWAQSADPAAEEANPRANFWRAVRKGDAGYSAVSGQETGVLIQNGGENWRALRNGPLTLYGGWFLVGVAVAILLFYLVRGTVKLERGRSGLTVPRWSAFERIVHWYTAMLFLLLMITGLSLLFGRYLLIPMIGKDAFAAWAGLAKQLHNYAGPFFAAGLLVELLKWVRHNIPKKVDAEWFARGGGMVGSKHPPAGRMNGGEKLWFWILATVGITMVASGFVLNFPNFEQTRGQMQLAHMIHTATAMVVMAVALGHIYIGTLGTEGAIQGMTTGRVDAEWAKQHHDLWYQDLLERGVRPEPEAEQRGGGGAATARRVQPNTT